MHAHGGPSIFLTGGEPINHPAKGVEPMQKWRCVPCDYVYDPEKGDPENGVAPGTAFEDLPDDWVCPDCSAGKELFEKME
jgi:rubredoxin